MTIFDGLSQPPLVWVATTAAHPDTNLGDALSAVVVAVLSGRPPRRAAFDRPDTRLAAVGTIGQNFKGGAVHFWGTGFDANRHPEFGAAAPYGRPADTQIVVHAVRGRFSGALMVRSGIEDPGVYGDPVLLLPKMVPLSVKKTRELGIILHISELESETKEANVKAIFKRYNIPEELRGDIVLINTFTANNFPAMRAKIEEIQSCRRILTTSLHGIVLAEIYGIPCAWFATNAGGPMRLSLDDPSARIDHRFRDFYSATNVASVLAYGQDRGKPTDWDSAVKWIDTAWTKMDYDGRALFDAFPLKKAVAYDDESWPVSEVLMASIKF